MAARRRPEKDAPRRRARSRPDHSDGTAGEDSATGSPATRGERAAQVARDLLAAGQQTPQGRAIAARLDATYQAAYGDALARVGEAGDRLTRTADTVEAATGLRVGGERLRELAGSVRDEEAADQPAVAEPPSGEQVAQLRMALTGSEPGTLTLAEAAEQAGVEPEFAARVYRAMGLAQAGAGDGAFGPVDVAALRDAAGLVATGWIEADTLVRLTRATGRSMAGLAAAQVDVARSGAESVLGHPLSASDPADRVRLAEAALDTALPAVGRLQEFVWRQHLLDATVRLVGAPRADGRHPTAVLVADLTGFSTVTRRLDMDGLAALVDLFEERAEGLLSDAGVRVVKLLGDGVLAVSGQLDRVLHAAQGLVAMPEREPDLPPVRVGVAWGDVLPWQGDVHGEPVVIAARLCAVAKPGTVLLDRQAGSLTRQAHGDGAVKSLRPFRVRGYEHLAAYRLEEPVTLPDG
jgi:adenylate cyclase